jgi:hypothetical protein
MVEIVRRRHFVTKFVEWAETLSGNLSILLVKRFSFR